MTSERVQAYEVQSEPQPEGRRRQTTRKIRLPSDEQREYQSRPDLQVEETAYAEDWSLENLQAERRSQRKATTHRQERRNRTNVPAKAARASSKRASRVVEYD